MALDGIRMPDGCYADGTWELSVHVTDLGRDVTLRVTGEIHIGGVMLRLVEKLGECPRHPPPSTAPCPGAVIVHLAPSTLPQCCA